jgi:hypothetical protein
LVFPDQPLIRQPEKILAYPTPTRRRLHQKKFTSGNSPIADVYKRGRIFSGRRITRDSTGFTPEAAPALRHTSVSSLPSSSYFCIFIFLNFHPYKNT